RQERDGSPAIRLDFTHNRLGAFRVRHIVDAYDAAAPSQQQGHCPPDPTRTPGHHRHLIGPFHLESPAHARPGIRICSRAIARRGKALAPNPIVCLQSEAPLYSPLHRKIGFLAGRRDTSRAVKDLARTSQISKRPQLGPPWITSARALWSLAGLPWGIGSRPLAISVCWPHREREPIASVRTSVRAAERY